MILHKISHKKQYSGNHILERKPYVLPHSSRLFTAFFALAFVLLLHLLASFQNLKGKSHLGNTFPPHRK